MKYKKIVFGLLLVAASFTACTKQLDSLLENPNYPSMSTADVDLYLNSIQISFNSFQNQASSNGAGMSRLSYWGGPKYNNGTTPAGFDGIWTTAYTSIFANVDAMIPLAITQKKYAHSGIARILKAYTLGTLVDQFGDVPYSQAVKGSGNETPAVDKGAAVYAAVISLLDSAIADLKNPASAAAPKVDLYYGGSKAKWITFANTLKLKFYMQERLVVSVKDKVQALITENDLINTDAQSFVFKYSKILQPDSRHPWYGGYNDNGGGGYLSNYFIWKLAAEKWGGDVQVGKTATAVITTGDPRLRYYFYRQNLNLASWANSETEPCYLNSQWGTSTFPAWYPSVPDQTPFCAVGSGYIGRDHGDNSGGPPDGAYVSQVGIYPAAGEFDYNQAKKVTFGMGAGGNGINPIWMSFYTSFLKAEAIEALGVTAPKTSADYFLEGVSGSITKVTGFISEIGYVNTAIPATTLANEAQITNYKTLVSNLYTAASTSSAKIDLIMSEYMIAAWGNGIEPYNNLRRTGSPKNVQLVVGVQSPGLFTRSFYYPSVFVNRNSNAPAQKSGAAANKVFWDNKPDNFIK